MKKWCLACTSSFGIFWPFLMVLAWKYIVWHFFEIPDSLAAVGLKLKAFSGDKGPLFSATVPFSKIQAILPSKRRHRARDIMRFWRDFENYGTLYSVLSSRLCCFLKKYTKVYANKVNCCAVHHLTFFKKGSTEYTVVCVVICRLSVFFMLVWRYISAVISIF